MLLAYRLVKLIEEHSDGLARSLHNRYQNCEKCSAYVNVPESELIEKVYDVYRHLGEWLLGKTEADVERRYLEVGARRAAQGVPVSQVVWMICLVRENLWDYLQKTCRAGASGGDLRRAGGAGNARPVLPSRYLLRCPGARARDRRIHNKI